MLKLPVKVRNIKIYIHFDIIRSRDVDNVIGFIFVVNQSLAVCLRTRVLVADPGVFSMNAGRFMRFLDNNGFIKR